LKNFERILDNGKKKNYNLLLVYVSNSVIGPLKELSETTKEEEKEKRNWIWTNNTRTIRPIYQLKTTSQYCKVKLIKGKQKREKAETRISECIMNGRKKGRSPQSHRGSREDGGRQEQIATAVGGMGGGPLHEVVLRTCVAFLPDLWNPQLPGIYPHAQISAHAPCFPIFTPYPFSFSFLFRMNFTCDPLFYISYFFYLLPHFFINL
jgi:hypothetical protein